MLTNFFKKSTPINYAVVVILLLLFFMIYQFNFFQEIVNIRVLAKKAVLFVFIMASIFITDFIAQKNRLVKSNTFSIFLYLLFLLFFPDVFNDFNTITANFFILLAFRRLVSLDSQKQLKEKIFDASVWVFIATLFQFWSVIFIVLVYVSILFNAANDYKNWLIPFVAFGVITVLFVLFSLIFQVDLTAFFESKIQTVYELNYFLNPFQNWAFSVYSTTVFFFSTVFVFSFSRLALQTQSAFKKIISFLIISAVMFLISSNKSNNLLLFSVAPMTIITTNYIETTKLKTHQEFVLISLSIISLFCFFSQLP
jgi:hypothetical protein